MVVGRVVGLVRLYVVGCAVVGLVEEGLLDVVG